VSVSIEWYANKLSAENTVTLIANTALVPKKTQTNKLEDHLMISASDLHSRLSAYFTAPQLLKLAQSCIYYLAFLIFGFSNGFIAPTLLWLVRRLNSSLFVIGFAITCRMIGFVICSPIIGRIYQWCEEGSTGNSQLPSQNSQASDETTSEEKPSEKPKSNSTDFSFKTVLPNFIIIGSFPLFALLLPLVPLVFHWSLLLLHGIALGFTNGIINVGCNVLMTKLWSDSEAASFVTFLHFMFGMGLFLGPLYVSLFTSSSSSSVDKGIELAYYSAGGIVALVTIVLFIAQVIVIVISRKRQQQEEGINTTSTELLENVATATASAKSTAKAANNDNSIANYSELSNNTNDNNSQYVQVPQDEPNENQQESLQQQDKEKESLSPSFSSSWLCSLSTAVALVTGMAMVFVNNSENLIMSFMGAYLEKQIVIGSSSTSPANPNTPITTSGSIISAASTSYRMLSVLWFSFTMGRLLSSILSQCIRPYIMLSMLLLVHGAAIVMWLVFPLALPYFALVLLGMGLSAQFPLVFSYPTSSMNSKEVDISTTMKSVMLMMPTIAALIIPNITTLVVQNYGYNLFFYFVGASYAAQLVWIVVMIVLGFYIMSRSAKPT